MRHLIRRFTPAVLLVPFLSCATSPAVDGQAPTPTPVVLSRASFETPLTVFISDLHFGLGRTSDNRWNPLDDFRWSRALKVFLDAISAETNDKTTLVIAGDLFEMWQHPSVRCRSGDADHGCTVAQMEQIARTIVAGHRGDLETLGAFAGRGGNHVVVIPGNHDAALMLPTVWSIVLPAFSAPAGKVERIDSGVWVSKDGQIVAEHGHQMPGEDVNGYKTWPRVTAAFRGKEFMLRPWGELFVAGLYDDVEQRYSLIDNLIPQSNGVRHYLKDRGFLGGASDVARFIAFNLTQTSLKQISDLGEPPTEGPPPWDVARARQLGWRLFARAIPPAGPEGADAEEGWYRAKLEKGEGREWLDVRARLDSLARDSMAIPDDEVRNLCDKVAAAATTEADICPRKDPTLGKEILKSLSPGARLRALQAHLKKRHEQVPGMRVFIYGHTHELQCTSKVTPEGLVPFDVANTGAFQRLADDAKFTKKASEMHITPAQALSRLTVEDLPPCYTAVLVRYNGADPVVSVKNWLMAETDATGQFVDPTDCRCAKLGSSCESGAPCP